MRAWLPAYSMRRMPHRNRLCPIQRESTKCKYKGDGVMKSVSKTEGVEKNKRSSWSLMWRFPQFSILLAFVVLFVFLAISTDAFFSVKNLVNVLRQASTQMIVAIGMTFCTYSWWHRPFRRFGRMPGGYDNSRSDGEKCSPDGVRTAAGRTARHIDRCYQRYYYFQG